MAGWDYIAEKIPGPEYRVDGCEKRASAGSSPPPRVVVASAG